MVLSVTERSFIYDSLVSSSTVPRTDSRKPNQFRPLKAICSFIPMSNGSSRIYLPDGLECITSIKAKVVRSTNIADLIKIETDIPGQRDDSSLCLDLSTLLTKSLIDNFDVDYLKLTDKYSFLLHIDIIVMSVPTDLNISSYTLYSLLSLASMGTYLALKSARLPLLISTVNDKEIEEEPSFADDWESSKYLIPRNEFDDDNVFAPSLLFVIGVAGKNCFVDPSLEEQQVMEHGICMGYNNGQVVPPIQSISLNNSDNKGIHKHAMIKAIKMVQEIAPSVKKALDSIASQELDEFGIPF